MIKIKPIHTIYTILFMLTSCMNDKATYVEESSFADICQNLPVESNRMLSLSSASNDWFQVYESYEGGLLDSGALSVSDEYFTLNCRSG